jgi:hypothetical protein
VKCHGQRLKLKWSIRVGRTDTEGALLAGQLPLVPLTPPSVVGRAEAGVGGWGKKSERCSSKLVSF